MPTVVYFNGSLSILTWVKIMSVKTWSRVIDCGLVAYDSNVFLALTLATSNLPTFQMSRSSSLMNRMNATETARLNEWFHLAAVLDNSRAFIYVNGILKNTANNWSPPLPVNRTSCYIGHSNWADKDADAHFDEIKIYNRALSEDEVQLSMNDFK